jgi:hypothetical protein
MARWAAKTSMAALGAMLALACHNDAAGPGSLLYAVMLNTDGTTFPCPATPGVDCVGFVGKGAVQGAFRLNNQTIQSEIDATDPHSQAYLFSLDVTDTYEYVCTWTTGTNNPTTHTVTHSTTTDISGDVDADPRAGPTQWNGFNLLGFQSAVESGDPIPALGDPCPGTAGTGATVTSVTLQSTAGGLFVTRTYTDPDQMAQLHWP